MIIRSKNPHVIIQCMAWLDMSSCDSTACHQPAQRMARFQTSVPVSVRLCHWICRTRVLCLLCVFIDMCAVLVVNQDYTQGAVPCVLQPAASSQHLPG